jgi:hypothetical protein
MVYGGRNSSQDLNNVDWFMNMWAMTVFSEGNVYLVWPIEIVFAKCHTLLSYNRTDGNIQITTV